MFVDVIIFALKQKSSHPERNFREIPLEVVSTHHHTTIDL